MSIYINDIPQYKTFTKIEPVNKGWSRDKKYYIETIEGKRLLLRISSINEYDKKKAEYDTICTVVKQGIPMSEPIDFGTCDNGKSVYMLLTWVDGNDAGEVLPTFSDEEQYELGIKAGHILKMIHSIPTPSKQEEWEIRFNRKIDRNIESYNKCDLKMKGVEKMLTYIEQNRHLLKNRPQSLQHGDYHIGNMIVSDIGALSVIDFNRVDYGDPWEEFNRIVWCADCSKYFATGRVNGYFDGKPPTEFWKLLALYISSNTLASIPWAISFGQVEIDTMTRQASQILEYYEDMTNVVPKWYIEDSSGGIR